MGTQATVGYNGQTRPGVKRVWYSGSDALEPGYALCYDVAATADASPVKTALGSAVVKPATANLMAFAGVVAPGQSKQGPCYVEIIVPQRGVFVDALCEADATAFTTALAPANGEYGLAAHTDATLNLPMIGVAAETADTASTAANKKVMLLGG